MLTKESLRGIFPQPTEIQQFTCFGFYMYMCIMSSAVHYYDLLLFDPALLLYNSAALRLLLWCFIKQILLPCSGRSDYYSRVYYHVEGQVIVIALSPLIPACLRCWKMLDSRECTNLLPLVHAGNTSLRSPPSARMCENRRECVRSTKHKPSGSNCLPDINRGILDSRFKILVPKTRFSIASKECLITVLYASSRVNI